MLFDESRLNKALSTYKRDFSLRWKKEKYKWEAVKAFQDNWNPDAADFSKMLADSLLVLAKKLPQFFRTRDVIVSLAKNFPADTRKMFLLLFDENHDFVERVLNFKDTAGQLFDKDKEIQKTYSYHQQPEGACTIYLWLRYPDKYFIYKPSAARALANELGYGYTFKDSKYRNTQAENLRHFSELYNEICKYIKADPDLPNLLKEHIAPDKDSCYPDKNFTTLTSDFGYYAYTTKNNPPPPPPKPPKPPIHVKSSDPYDKNKFLEEVFMKDEDYNDLVDVLGKKLNIILKGAPGVGKTFAATRLAYSIMKEKDDSRIKIVQFHQNYSYEEFMKGYKPSGDGFSLENGVFYEFCKLAAAEKDRTKHYFFIIDEINRGNISKIFGELLMLIEREYRDDVKVTLPYKVNGAYEEFSIPKNLYIIGTMNTTDRSIALIDHALRRRFSHFELKPAFGSEEFNKWLEKYGNGKDNKEVQSFIGNIIELNKAIAKSLGKGFSIGHSYFCEKKKYTAEDLKFIREYEIIPALEEYWFDDPKNLDDWTKVLRGEKTVSDIKNKNKNKKEIETNDTDDEGNGDDGE